jgi:hypothetical protein
MNRASRRSYQFQESDIFEPQQIKYWIGVGVGGSWRHVPSHPMTAELPDDDDGLQATLAAKPSSIVDRYGGKSFEPLALRHFGTRGCKSLKQYNAVHITCLVATSSFAANSNSVRCTSISGLQIVNTHQHSIFYHPINSSLHITSLAEVSRRPRIVLRTSVLGISQWGKYNSHQNQSGKQYRTSIPPPTSIISTKIITIRFLSPSSRIFCAVSALLHQHWHRY